MNKFDLVEEIVLKTGYTRKDVETILDCSFETMVKNLKKGEEVKVTGFGTFSLKKRQARNGTNPKTGAKIHIPEAKFIGFKASKKIDL